MKTYLIITSLIVIGLGSCAKFIEVSVPSNALTGEAVFQSDKTATAAVNGLYSNLSSDNRLIGGINGVSMIGALLSDELFLHPVVTGEMRNIFENNMTSSQFGLPWRFLYKSLHDINSTLHGITNSKTLDVHLKRQLEGECKFLRAFCYFYLVTLYGDVPLLLTPDWKINTEAKRTPQSEIWSQITIDLKESKEQLSENFLMGDGMTEYELGSAERVRPTKWAASSLLARVYLYTKDWQNAEIEASQVIGQIGLFSLEPSLDKVFLKNSVEAIWQLMPVIPGRNTMDASVFVITSAGFFDLKPAFIPLSFYDQFAGNDLRKLSWIGSVDINGTQYYYPYKYKVIRRNSPLTEYQMILRLSELYLIRAEARAKLGKLSDGLVDLNAIRSRAGLTDTATDNENELVNAIVQERRLELFTEWGHRWLDLKRWGIIDDVMKNVTPIKSNGKEWKSYQQLMPIELSDIQINPNLLPNNPGY